MTYPRNCPLCRTDYRLSIRSRPGVSIVSDLRHGTLSARPGGTPSPWVPALPGRLLTLRCRACDGEYAWDYFIGRPADGAVLAPRPPQRAARREVIMPDAQEEPRTAATIEAIGRPDEAFGRRDVDALMAPATEDVVGETTIPHG